MSILKKIPLGILGAFVLACVPVALQAQFTPSAIKIGYLSPKDAQPGLLLGTEMTFKVDETVELGVSTNLFYKNYKQLSVVAAPGYAAGINERVVQQELEYSTFSLPLYAIVNVVIPTGRYFGYQLHGGLGYEFLFNKENNYLEQKSERRFYKGLSWISSVGFHYIIGSRSALIGEVLYHSARVSRNRSESAEGLPVWSEVNLSGFGFRFGIRLGMM